MTILNTQKPKYTWRKEWTVVSSGCIKASLASQLVETVAYVFTDIPLLKERALEMITKCGRAEAQSWS